MEAKVNILGYTDYREFLKDYYRQEKERNPKFSHRFFVKKAGFSSPIQLHAVMEGVRNLSKDGILKFSLALGLTKREQQYFETLVSHNQAKTPETQSYYFELLRSLRKDKIGTPLDDDKFEFLSKWFYPAIRELVALPYFSDDPEWIRKALKNRVTTKEARQAMDALTRLGLIKNENGKFVQIDQNLITEDDLVHDAAYQFHQQILNIAKDTLANTYPNERQCSGLMMPMSTKQFYEVKKMIREFEDTVIRFLNEHPETPESVFHLNTMLFSLTEKETN